MLRPSTMELGWQKLWTVPWPERRKPHPGSTWRGDEWKKVSCAVTPGQPINYNWEVLRQIGWPTLAWRRRRNNLLFLWDLLNKQGPPDLASDIPKLASERADYSLRGPSLAFPRCLTSQRLKSFLPASIELFNSLPASVSSSSSRSSFLFALDRHFSKDIFSFGLT